MNNDQKNTSVPSVVIACENLSKTFADGEREVHVLADVNFSLTEGEQVAIIGSSGSGKSTLLQLLGGLDTPTKGSVTLDGIDLNTMTEKQRCLSRNNSLGFVYQFHHLLPEFTALENVAMPLLIRGEKIKKITEKAKELLVHIGLEKRLHHKIGELSGGERQRVAIARALVTEPRCLLADEPTGNLDPRTAEKIYAAMLQLNRDLKTSFIIVTHDYNLAAQMDRTLTIKDGKLI